MSRGFSRARDGVRCRLSPAEADVVRHVVREVEALIAPDSDHDDAHTGAHDDADELEQLLGLTGQVPERPTDPAVVRLFPDAYDDPDESAEFRRYTQADLYAEKRARLATVVRTLTEDEGNLVLGAEDAHAWLGALTDVRLVLGSRLGLENDDDVDTLEHLPAGDPRAALADVYDFLTFLQETLVRALAGW